MRSRAIICFLLGLIGAAPMVVLTPPFQVPDESQHFLRAFQLSELQVRGIVLDGEAGAVLPSALIELIERFLGTRAVFADRPITANPLGQTWTALSWPLDPDRREFISLTYLVYPPPSYLPQVIAIATGRWLGAGPLGLLYMSRLANALAAVSVLAWAVSMMPVGRELMMLFGLLPMAVYEYASASPDAAAITTAFLFTAVALRCLLRAHWSPREVALAVVSGLLFCGHKPVYAPLLLIGLPAALVRGRVRHVLLVHAVIIVVVLGGVAAWLRFAALGLSRPEWSSAPGQASFIEGHPLGFIWIIADSFWHAHLYFRSAVGVFGWLMLPLTTVAYVFPVCGFLLGTLAQPWNGPKLSIVAVAWNAVLLTGVGFLIMTSAYLLWNTVGSARVEHVQGRYFLPLLALAAAAWCSAVRVLLSRRESLAAFLMLVAVIGVEYAAADLTIVRAYHVF